MEVNPLWAFMALVPDREIYLLLPASFDQPHPANL